MTAVLSGRGLVVRYGAKTVLDELDITVGGRECLAIRGVNGCGRTTLLEVLATLRVPTAGTLTINGIDARRTPRVARTHLALVSADLVRGDGLTVREYLAIVASPPRAERMRSLTVPTLVLHGDRDTLIDQIGGVRTAELIPGARLEIIEGMGHDYPPGLWRRWTDLVVGHLRAHS